MIKHLRHPRRSRGITLLECILLVVTLSIVTLGFSIALYTTARTPSAVDKSFNVHARLVEKMEDLLSLDYTVLAANSGLSDNVTVSGQTYTRTVTVANVDADGINGVDSDFLEITVTINGQFLKTRVTQP